MLSRAYFKAHIVRNCGGLLGWPIGVTGATSIWLAGAVLVGQNKELMGWHWLQLSVSGSCGATASDSSWSGHGCMLEVCWEYAESW